MTVLLLFAPLILHAQDTTQAYPWRFSNFPYITATPNDGVMLMYRGVFFRQSRWDDRTSIEKQVALEGGYSTHDSWLVRATVDMPRVGGRGRFQFVGSVEHDARFVLDTNPAAADRQSAAAEFSVPLPDHWFIALRSTGSHIGLTGLSESTLSERVALVLDLRDREYDTRSGALLQAGAIAGYVGGPVEIGSSRGFTGWYGLASGWLPLGPQTRITARAGIRRLSESAASSIEAMRTFPAWEDAFTVIGGAQSNRALPVGEFAARQISLLSGEIRHDLKVFPGGAIGVLAFVDAGDATNHPAGIVDDGDTQAEEVSGGWVVGAGGGLSLRLLRNAVLTATLGVARGNARLYVSSGWSW